ncbi:Vacuolar protein sorting-associated protein [Wickerhamomyces ciferrii]|uniref:Vacuolar protein sorting-associated protein n=1 Tax=Wickerhamomyces ciferrii (strain ATCC 14091 / BCRC 22168 / CBS 111 / JCM 3599 / NBRC 0793 / NRRL Y-1031 F-60-10) TaxID=1206466 RepID=K0KPS6_WICCF|nr:Vacuolar protein sorting-associated protein [Wickerhamomyces ciferrii]CCH45016.1 Vacuolar protein sorting-associated protein [Wickerhamomyces ciferrii]
MSLESEDTNVSKQITEQEQLGKVEKSNGNQVNGNGNGNSAEKVDDGVVRSDSEEEEDDDDNDNTEDEEKDEDEEEDEESSSEEEEEDEDPPMLKYSRLLQLPKTFFNKELVSSCLIHEHVFAFGTASGLLYITNPDLQSLGTIRARKSPILSIHTDGSYIAAASMDGTIVISSINQVQTNNQASTVAYDIKTPIYSVVINGQYKETKSFIYGNKKGQVIISTTNWLGNRTERIIGEDSGPIVGLVIMEEVLIWMSDDGITALNLSNEHIITKLNRPKNSPPAELIWPRINQLERDRLLIGWVDHIWSIKISTSIRSPRKGDRNFGISSAMSSFSRPSSEANISVEFEYSIDGLIGGIATFKDDSLIVLTISNSKDQPPELRVINSITHGEISTDEIVLKGYQGLRINDFHLGQYIGSQRSKFFIISATDGIIAEEFDLLGRFNWFVERERFLEAWEMSEHLITKEQRGNIGIKQVQVYLDDNNWFQAARFLKQILTIHDPTEQVFKDYTMEKWEQWAWIFIHSDKIPLLAEILPLEIDECPKEIYNKCLEWFLNNDNDQIFEYLNRWDTSLFDYKRIEELIENKLEVEPELSILRRCLAELYLKTQDVSSSIKHFIELKDPNTIDLLSQNHLVSKFIEYLPTIIRFQIGEEDLKDAPIQILGEKSSHIIDILVENRHEIIPHKIIPLLNQEGLEIITFLYLQKISKVDPLSVELYETEMVELYSKFDRSQLLTYLKKKQHYNIEKVMEIMKLKNFNEELVYLLGKVGKSKEAMYLIIETMDDPKQAIEFATEQKSSELWQIFLEYGIKKPNFIKVLIEYTGILFDPQILKKIPEKVEVEGLKDSLIRITKDNKILVSIQESILKILENEAVEVSDELNELRTKGKVVIPTEIFNQFEKVLLLANGELKSLV